MPVSADLLKQANAAATQNAQLYKLLQNWEQAGGHSAGPMSANAAPQRPLSPELAAALAAHLKLPKQMQPDELDAAETMLALEGGGLGAAKKRTKASKVYEAAEPLEGEQPKKVYESHKQCAPNEFGMNKAGGWYSEVIGSNINPLNLIGNPAAALAAYLTPTRSLKEQAQADKSTWSNVLIPGKGAYNRWKRLGMTMRSPEIIDARQELKTKKKTPGENPGSQDLEEKQSTFEFGATVGRAVFKQATAPRGGWEEWSPNPLAPMGSRAPIFQGIKVWGGQQGPKPGQANQAADEQPNPLAPLPNHSPFFKGIKVWGGQQGPKPGQANPAARANSVDQPKAAAFNVKTAEKSNFKNILNALLLPAAGAGVGATVGAIRAPKGKKLRGAGGGALVGGGLGAGAEFLAPGLGLGLKYNLQDLTGSVQGRHPDAKAYQQFFSRPNETAAYGKYRESLLPGLMMLRPFQKDKEFGGNHWMKKPIDQLIRDNM